MFMLGYEIEIGHMEAINLVSSVKYNEKQVVGSTFKAGQALIQLQP